MDVRLFSEVGRRLPGLGRQCQAYADGSQYIAVLPYRPSLEGSQDTGVERARLVAAVAGGHRDRGWRAGGMARRAPARSRHRAGEGWGRGKGMTRYIIRRLLYGILILIGVNLLTFVLFFAVNTPDDMARLSIGGQRVSESAIERWKAERGYDRPLFVNTAAEGSRVWTDTIFYARSVPLLRFDFGFSDEGRDIGHEIASRMGPSLALALPTFILGLTISIAFSLLLVFFKGTRLDFAGVVLCVVLLSISGL